MFRVFRRPGRTNYLFASLLLLASPQFTKAACHVITPSGSGSNSGADWNNACSAFSGNCASLVRGDTYYLGDGNYGGIGSFQGASGATVTTLKKASDTGIRDGDHGQNCSPSVVAGWNGAMGSASGQAQWVLTGSNGWNLAGISYVTIDGGNDGSTFGCGQGSATCGIGMDASACSANNCDIVHLQDSGSAGADHMMFKFIQFKGTAATTHKQDFFFYSQGCCSGGSVSSNILISHTLETENYASDVQFRDVNGYTLDRNVFYHEALSSTFHGEVLSEAGSSNIVVRYNLFPADGGTGILVVLSDNTSFSYTTTNMDVYGNVFYDYSNSTNGEYGVTTNGTVSCINSRVLCNNFHIYNNTFVNLNNTSISSTPTAGYGNGDGAGGGSGWICENNLFYKINSSASNGWSIRADCMGGVVDYNSAVFSGSPSGMNHPHDVVVTSDTSPFASLPSAWPLLGNWHVSSQNSSWDAGVIVPSSLPYGAPPYTGCTVGLDCPNIDPDGNIRGGSFGVTRGAFQFGGNTASLPAPPQNLQVTSIH